MGNANLFPAPGWRLTGFTTRSDTAHLPRVDASCIGINRLTDLFETVLDLFEFNSAFRFKRRREAVSLPSTDGLSATAYPGNKEHTTGAFPHARQSKLRDAALSGEVYEGLRGRCVGGLEWVAV